jgi:hypothetical protein
VYQDQTPAHQQRLDAVGKGVRLEGPRDIRRRDQRDSDTASARRLDQLMDRPVLHDDAQREHEYAQRPVHDRRRDIISKPLPEPAQDVHGPAVCKPQREGAADRVVRRELPCFVDGIGKDAS